MNKRTIKILPMSEEVYAPVIDTSMTYKQALTEVCTISKSHLLLTCGFRQVSSILMREKVKFLLLAKDNEPNASLIINALCKEKCVPVISIDSRREPER